MNREETKNEFNALIKQLRDQAENAFGWMEGADLEEFLRYEGMYIAYSEAAVLVKKLGMKILGEWKHREIDLPSLEEELDGD
jgi:hypothetical protein